MLDMFREALLQDGMAADHIIAINFELMEYDEIRDYRTFYRLVLQLFRSTLTKQPTTRALGLCGWLFTQYISGGKLC